MYASVRINAHAQSTRARDALVHAPVAVVVVVGVDDELSFIYLVAPANAAKNLAAASNLVTGKQLACAHNQRMPTVTR